MSGTLISTARGKVPQRALRYIDQLPYLSTYNLGVVDYGAGDVAFELQSPASRRGKVIAVNVFQVTEVFSTTTTQASVEIGDGSDQDGYCYTDDFGALAVANADVFTSYDGSLVEGALGAIIPENVEFVVTTVAPTGGTPTGIAMTSVDVMYFE